MRVAFRVDASMQMGSGHVMRCLTLAEALHERNAEVLIVSRRHPGHLCDLLARRGFRVAALPAASVSDEAAECASQIPGLPRHAHWIGASWDEDAAQTHAALREDGGLWDWLVVDHYGIDARWECALRPATRRILAIDDLDDRPHDADLILDQGFYGSATGRYAGNAGPGTLLLLGPRYALLRPEFAAARAGLRKRSGKLRRLLIYFGAYDATGQTLKSVRALRRAAIPDLEAHVIMGTGAPDRQSIEAVCGQLDNVVLHSPPIDMAAAMADADLAIGAAGTTTWERCCLGLPSLLISVASNQDPVAENLAEDGSCVYLGRAGEVTEDQIADSLRALGGNPRWLSSIGKRCGRLVDGGGTQRIVNRLTAGTIVLRRATNQDAMPLFEWRNAPESRRFALDPSPLQLDAHLAWLDAVLADANRILLVAESGGAPVGVLRYDVSRNQAEVSIYLVPGNHGRGLGAQILAAGSDWMRQHRDDVHTLIAEIRPENHSSIQAFKHAGYVAGSYTYRRSLRE